MEEKNPQIDALIRLSDSLLRLRQFKETIEAQLSDANKEIEQTEALMLASMEACRIDKFAHADKLFYPIVQSYPKILDQDKFYTWLEEHGEDGIIKRTVHPQTLRAWYKEQALEHGEQLVGERMIEAFEKIKVGVRASK